MNEHMLSAVHSLPRQRLEDLAIRALTEVRFNQRETTPNAYFLAVLTGFSMGTFVTAVGFLVGAALR